MRPILPVSLLPILAAPGLAQGSWVVPKQLAGIEGPSSTFLPFGVDQPIRHQCLYDPEALPFQGPTQLTGIALRADWSAQAGYDQYPLKQYLVTFVYLSSTRVRSDGVSARFQDNHGPDQTKVISDARIALPAQPPMASGPRPATVLLPFAAPWWFATTPVTPAPRDPLGLVVEIQVNLQPAGMYRLDTPFLCDSGRTSFGRLGPRCVSSRAGRPIALEVNDSLKAGEALTFTVTELPNRAPFGVFLGATDNGTWNGFRIPFDLGVIGGHDCWLNTEMLAIVIGTADDQGIGRLRFDLPSSRSIVGQEMRAQAVAQDISANPLLYVTSLGLRATVCGPLGVARVHSLGTVMATTGQVLRGAGLVMELR